MRRLLSDDEVIDAGKKIERETLKLNLKRSRSSKQSFRKANPPKPQQEKRDVVDSIVT